MVVDMVSVAMAGDEDAAEAHRMSFHSIDFRVFKSGKQAGQEAMVITVPSISG